MFGFILKKDCFEILRVIIFKIFDLFMKIDFIKYFIFSYYPYWISNFTQLNFLNLLTNIGF